MRNLLLLLTFLIGINSFGQRIVCHPMGSTQECVLAYAAFREFVDDSNVVIVFNPITPLYEAFDGITYQYSKYFYQISISIRVQDDRVRLWTIFHEVGHVLDLYYGHLTQFPLTWKGKRVSENLPWGERPWEKSADEWAYRIWKRLVDGEPPAPINENFILSPKSKKPSCIKH